MMEFGDWLADTRKRLGLDIRSFAEKTKVDASTISRTENQETQATLYTAFRICEGLDISFSEFFQQLKGPFTLPLPWNDNPVKGVRVLSIEDVENFIAKFYSHEDSMRELLANLLNEISYRLSKATKHRKYAENAMIEVQPEDIDKMLYGFRLFTGFHLQYPWEISANIIFDTFQHNGVLEVDDVDVFMQDIVMKGRGEHKLLSRLQGGVLERIRLVD